MKSIVCYRTIDIPDGVTVNIRSRKINIIGPRGRLIRDFKHILIDIKLEENKKKNNSKSLVRR